MLQSIKLKAGPFSDQPGLEVPLTPVTVFVGPNNSGKSLALREIESLCRHASGNFSQVVTGIEHEKLSPEVLEEFFRNFKSEPLPTEVLQANHAFIQVRSNRLQVNVERLRRAISDPQRDYHFFANQFLAHYTLRLDGSGRVNLCVNQQAGDMQAPPQNKFSELFRDDQRRAEVRKIVHEALGVHLVVDPTNLGQLRLRLSDEAPIDTLQEKGIHPEAVDFHSRAAEVQQASDGVKAFVGILVELFMGSPKIIMIDEPEAFLHPSLARRLGKEISTAAQIGGKKVFASTHSPSFLMGCIESHVPVNIVRLTYTSRVATARLLDSRRLVALMRNPLLRSTNVLDGLFYENVVVTESDSDRAFYQQINERLLRFEPERGLKNCLFLNAQNKQTVPTIVEPLRALGIAAAIAVDVDVLKCKGAEWLKFMTACSFPEISRAPLSQQRELICRALESTGKDMKRDRGLNLLQGEDHLAARESIDGLSGYGFFVVFGGELESWLSNLCAAGHGPYWLVQMFEKMGEDPDDESYVKPEPGDVWGFIETMQGWFSNPNRKGMPLSN